MVFEILFNDFLFENVLYLNFTSVSGLPLPFYSQCIKSSFCFHFVLRFLDDIAKSSLFSFLLFSISYASTLFFQNHCTSLSLLIILQSFSSTCHSLVAIALSSICQSPLLYPPLVSLHCSILHLSVSIAISSTCQSPVSTALSSTCQSPVCITLHQLTHLRDTLLISEMTNQCGVAGKRGSLYGNGLSVHRTQGGGG